MRLSAVILTSLALIGLAPTSSNHHPMRFVYRPALDQATHAHPLLARDVPQSFDGLNAAITNEVARRRAVAEAAARAAAPPPQRVRVVSAPRPVASVPSQPSVSGCAYEAQIRAVFGAVGSWAVAIAMRESRCTPDAKSPTGCWGLFQLCVPLHLDLFRSVCPTQTAQLGNAVALDPACNIAAAWKLYQGAGTGPWHL